MMTFNTYHSVQQVQAPIQWHLGRVFDSKIMQNGLKQSTQTEIKPANRIQPTQLGLVLTGLPSFQTSKQIGQIFCQLVVKNPLQCRLKNPPNQTCQLANCPTPCAAAANEPRRRQMAKIAKTP